MTPPLRMRRVSPAEARAHAHVHELVLLLERARTYARWAAEAGLHDVAAGTYADCAVSVATTAEMLLGEIERTVGGEHALTLRAAVLYDQVKDAMRRARRAAGLEAVGCA